MLPTGQRGRPVVAKVLTEQPSLPAATAADPRQFGDGAPLHSAEAFDLARTLNNMATYREPSFQFAHDVSLQILTTGGTDARNRIIYRVKGVGGGDGQCMLGQLPIYVPVDAVRLRWSLGIYRDPASSVEGTAVHIDVDSITMYLSSEPCRNLDPPGGVADPVNDENMRRWPGESALTGPYTKNVVNASANSDGPNTVYTRVRSDTWTDFAPRGTDNINDRTGDPTAYLIAVATFSNGVTNEQIRGAELSVWFEYDDASFLLDDAGRGPARNGKAALAQVYRRIIETANKFSCRPRPIHSFWGGNGLNMSESDDEGSFRRMWITGEMGAPRIKGLLLAVPIADALAVPSTGLTLFTTDQDQGFAPVIPQTPGRREDLNEASTEWCPRYLTPISIFGEQVADYSSPATARDMRIISGDSSPLLYGPQARSCLIIERRIKDPVIGIEALPLDPYTMGAEILGVGPTYRDLRAMRDFINRLARQKMMHFGWGIQKNSATAVYGHNVTNGNGVLYRYILNPTIGEGDTAPSVNGPGIEIPLANTSLGKGTTVRAYVRIYARMTGATNTARLAQYQRDDAGGMDGLTLLANTPVISGTTWRWWPNTTTINEVTDPYITLNANPAYDTNNLVLCAGRNGTTDDLLVGAWTICVRASEAT